MGRHRLAAGILGRSVWEGHRKAWGRGVLRGAILISYFQTALVCAVVINFDVFLNT